jgi:alkylhydroperoxidase/carboxymuconolactone decarboxylase family protein YurZ
MANPMNAFLEDEHAFTRTWQDGDEPPVLQRVLAGGGVRRKWQEMLAEFQPDVLELWDDRRRRYKPRELDPKTRELIAIALAMFVDSHHITNHFNAAYEKGATTQELIDVCVVTGNLYGAKSWDIGLTALDRVIEERTRLGLPVPRDREAGR